MICPKQTQFMAWSSSPRGLSVCLKPERCYSHRAAGACESGPRTLKQIPAHGASLFFFSQFWTLLPSPPVKMKSGR